MRNITTLSERCHLGKKYFIKSESVYVSQREVFKKLLLKWTEDPCGNDDDDNDDVDSVNIS